MKELPFRRHQWLSFVIDRAQREGCEGCAGEITRRLCNQAEQTALVQFAHQCRSHLAQGEKALRSSWCAMLSMGVHKFPLSVASYWERGTTSILTESGRLFGEQRSRKGTDRAFSEEASGFLK